MSWHQLPLEVQRMIQQQCVYNRSLGLLRVNQSAYKDTLRMLGQDFVLSFRVDPSDPAMMVKILNQNGRTLDLTSPYPDNDSIVARMSVDKFRRIEIFIDAPDPKDPGQLVRGWQKVTRLVAALMPRWVNAHEAPEDNDDIWWPKAWRSTELPPMTVIFNEGDERSWMSGDNNGIKATVYNRSIPSYDRWTPDKKFPVIGNEECWSDVEVILEAFQRVRHIARLSVVTAAPLPREGDRVTFDHSKFTTTIELGSGNETPFGLNVDRDNVTLAREDCMHAWLNYLLDDMAGPSASLLRRDRFEHWDVAFQTSIHDSLFGRSSFDDDVLGGCEETFEQIPAIGVQIIVVLMPDGTLLQRPHTLFHEVVRVCKRRALAQGICEDRVRAAVEASVVERNRRQPESTIRNFEEVQALVQEHWRSVFPGGIVRKSEMEGWKDE